MLRYGGRTIYRYQDLRHSETRRRFAIWTICIRKATIGSFVNRRCRGWLHAGGLLRGLRLRPGLPQMGCLCLLSCLLIALR